MWVQVPLSPLNNTIMKTDKFILFVNDNHYFLNKKDPQLGLTDEQLENLKEDLSTTDGKCIVSPQEEVIPRPMSLLPTTRPLMNFNCIKLPETYLPIIIQRIT